MRHLCIAIGITKTKNCIIKKWWIIYDFSYISMYLVTEIEYNYYHIEGYTNLTFICHPVYTYIYIYNIVLINYIYINVGIILISQ